MVIQGKVEDWRVARKNSYNLYCSWVKEPVSIYGYTPLPFDPAIEDQQLTQEQVDAHLQKMANFDWSQVGKN